MNLIAKLCGIAVVMPMLAVAQVPAAYRTTALPFDSGTLVINNAGDVAGMVDGRVALWQRGSGLSYLTASGEYATFADMNDLGQLVGASGDRPTIWQLGRQPVSFDAGVYGGSAIAINNNGTMVAMARGLLGEEGREDDYFIYKDGQRTSLYGFFPSEINDREQIVGNLRGPGGHGAIWQDGTLHALPDDGYSWSATINDQGWVAGGTSDGSLPIHGAIWKGGQPEVYGPGYAYGINNAGLAVGFSYDAQHAMLFYGGQTYDLNDLWDSTGWEGWSLISAEDVNNAGDIVVVAGRPGGGGEQMLLLSPVPEPANAWLLLAGLLLFGGLHRAIAGNPIAQVRTI
ncbi:PEP-CTERM domain protein [Pseudoduganella violaceinigra]|uniref:PEP-CTERM domain protein n=1 Tax=Pseudoduganella violaceinigra TaxID=246602 RepID=UPI0004003DBF|nr:PEP-CTERM domain protein [Pseudoduganella violaceinigra]